MAPCRLLGSCKDPDSQRQHPQFPNCTSNPEFFGTEECRNNNRRCIAKCMPNGCVALCASVFLVGVSVQLCACGRAWVRACVWAGPLQTDRWWNAATSTRTLSRNASWNLFPYRGAWLRPCLLHARGRPVVVRCGAPQRLKALWSPNPLHGHQFYVLASVGQWH